MATLPEGSDPSRAGYDFLGWNTEPDGSGARIGVDVTPQPTEGEELEFYAIWKAIPYTVVLDLSKNPDEVDLAASLVWPGHSVAESSKNVFKAEGITVEMGPQGQVELPDSRGTKRTDYRFLGWAEGDEVPVYKDDQGLWRLDLTALPDPGVMLTARWAFKFGVIVPSDITFGDYDLLNQAGQGYATTETSEQDHLDGADGTPGGGEAAYFQSSTHSTDLEIVGLESKQQASAKDVLFAKQGSQDQIWSQNLLSLFPLPSGADGEEIHGVHFKLEDVKDESSFLSKGFGIPKEAIDGTPGKLYASYRLNLDTAWQDGTQNEAMVGNGITADRSKTNIAKVTYEFGIAQDGVDPSVPIDEALYIRYDGKILELDEIKRDSVYLANRAGQSSLASDATYQLYHSFLLSGMDPDDPKDPHGYVRWGDGRTYNVRIVGINHNTEFLYDPNNNISSHPGSSYAYKGPVGLTFQFVDALADTYQMNPSLDGTIGSYVAGTANNTNLWGWGRSMLLNWGNWSISTNLVGSGGDFVDDNRIYDRIPPALLEKLAEVERAYLLKGSASSSAHSLYTTFNHVWPPNYWEVTTSANRNGSYAALSKEDNRSKGTFEWYAHALADAGDPSAVYQKSQVGAGSAKSPANWWLSSVDPSNNSNFLGVSSAGAPGASIPASMPTGYAPCFSL